MKRILLPVLALGLAAASGAQEAEEAPAAPERRIVLETSSAAGLSVHFLTIPWGPQTFAAMEAPGEGFYNRRTWPFARLETEVEFKLAGHPVEPGNYALVFHPNNERDEGMSLEVLRIGPGEFLQPGSVYTPTPPGERLFKLPVTFDTAEGISPTLKVQLSPNAGKTSLVVQYGDKRLIRDIER